MKCTFLHYTGSHVSYAIAKFARFFRIRWYLNVDKRDQINYICNMCKRFVIFIRFLNWNFQISLPVLPPDKIHHRLSSHNDPVLPALWIVIQHDDQLIRLELKVNKPQY